MDNKTDRGRPSRPFKKTVREAAALSGQPVKSLPACYVRSLRRPCRPQFNLELFVSILAHTYICMYVYSV